MATIDNPGMSVPFIEILKGIPGLVGIRLEEQPKYAVLRRDRSVEVRDYSPVLAARVTLDGTRENALNEGFQALAAYIFGANSGSAHIAMTAPVLHERKADPIAMTAPVLNERHGEGWTISFVLPSKYTAASIPRPLDPRITIDEVPRKTVAVVTYSGTNDDAKMAASGEALREWLIRSHAKPLSAIRWAQYDPPFALPFLKKNEAQIDIALQ
jgi:SOUL heme-binding protein